MYNERLKYLREEKELTQTEVSELLGFRKNGYSQFEREQTTIPIKHLNTLSNYFNVSIDYVVGFNNKKKYANQKPDIKIKVTGENLKKIRLKKGLTQVQISSELKINQPTWNRYENAKNLILTTTLYELAKKYHYSIDKILGKDRDSDNE